MELKSWERKHKGSCMNNRLGRKTIKITTMQELLWHANLARQNYAFFLDFANIFSITFINFVQHLNSSVQIFCKHQPYIKISVFVRIVSGKMRWKIDLLDM